MFRHLITLFSLLTLTSMTSTLVYGQELILTPSTCVIADPEQNCKIDIDVEFQSSQLVNFCLWIDGIRKHDKCFQGKHALTEQLSLTLAHDTLIELRDFNDRVLAEGLIKVATFEPINTRRRRGLGWNLL